MINLTSEQWELYLQKYNKLMWKISHRISGDLMTASLEDNYSDLSIAAMESINGFNKKTGKTFDEMIHMKLFDQYTKTCLWTAKARKGIKLTERMPFRNSHVSIDALQSDPDTSFDIPDTSAVHRYNKIINNDLINNKGSEFKDILKAVEDNPKVFTAKGKVKIGPISRATGISSHKVKKILDTMEDENAND